MSRRIEGASYPIIYPNVNGMIDLGLDTLVAQGRKRIAVVVTVPMYTEVKDYLRQAIGRRPITVHERWMQIVPHEMPEAVRNNVLMLMNPGSDERPDGLFVMDDNLAENASSGLVAIGARVPQDVAVVAHCNFPWSTPSVLPIQRVGFDTKAIFDQALRIVDMQRRGNAPPAVTRIEAELNGGE
jgi:DNA-binding LacI/PurR family transcriptional regulator